ncbi:MAG TPA: TIGR00730 family Rossman fold protein [Rhizomicrobium sp.]|nr:TIGR00730 family Rossman fold protein [Rhizomicrobium sp.]
MDKNKPAICVFCGSSFGTNPRFREVARAMGAGIAGLGFSLVFGGGGLGLMGDVAAAAQAGGASIQGIIPAFLQSLEPPVSAEEKLIVTPHIQERKALMLQMSDAFVVLPGGLGTFDEFFEVATEAQLGVHKKPIIVVNVDGYFDALDAMLHSIVEKGFAKPMIMELYHLAESPEAALGLLKDLWKA